MYKLSKKRKTCFVPTKNIFCPKAQKKHTPCSAPSRPRLYIKKLKRNEIPAKLLLHPIPTPSNNAFPLPPAEKHLFIELQQTFLYNLEVAFPAHPIPEVNRMCQRIRSLREDRDLKQKQLAELCGVAQTTYSDYETGKLSVPIPVLKKLAVYYQVSIDYLVGLTDTPTPYPPKTKKSR